MYSAKLRAKITNNETTACLYAKFRFSTEVAPNEKEYVRKRLQQLGLYFMENEGMHPRVDDNGTIYLNEFEGNGRKVKVSECKFCLGFDVAVRAGKGNLDSLLNLEGINAFILSGDGKKH